MSIPASGLLLDLVLPARCLACGSSLLGDREGYALVCEPCRSGLINLPEPRCEGCGRPLSSERGLCMACRVAPRDFDEAWPLFDFRGTAGALIAAFKFGRRPALAAFFAELLLPVIAAKWTEWTVVPVPPRREVLTSRGWDQVELLARQLEKRGRPVARVLERLPSLEQKTLGLEDRKANAAKAYRMRRDVAAPRKALLVDDVYTTGATADACARALSRSGSERVAFVAIAAD